MTCYICERKQPGRMLHCQQCDAPVCKHCHNDDRLCTECTEQNLRDQALREEAYHNEEEEYD